MALTNEDELEQQQQPTTSTSPTSGGSSLKQKLHSIGEKLALVPPSQEELHSRLDKAEREGNEEEISKIHMKIAASGQNASTSQEDA
ncbi:hypothetical protein P389DRAFT_196657 [Cystobasidium minutum MCA 4210]|uniref:uncharacterized protein n=1 Tax=Cystobasidium minutum MCA 4210 TaxID=1397322 RepID=UPI0034CD1534|eukprot:jgi/Rhomi1/196657/gm1.4871_g